MSAHETYPSKSGVRRGEERDVEGEMDRRAAEANVDGGVRDGDVFVLGDEEDEGEAEGTGGAEAGNGSRTPPPAYSSTAVPTSGGPPTPDVPHSTKATTTAEGEPSGSVPAPSKYYLLKGDTILGISLKFGIDVSVPCCSPADVS